MTDVHTADNGRETRLRDGECVRITVYAEEVHIIRHTFPQKSRRVASPTQRPVKKTRPALRTE
jgi:stress response protein YsnF